MIRLSSLLDMFNPQFQTLIWINSFMGCEDEASNKTSRVRSRDKRELSQWRLKKFKSIKYNS